MKHQKAQSETTKGAPENQQKTVFSRDFHLQLILIGQLTQLSQNYFALQSLHKALPSTTLYYKACTKHFPVLRCTTKLAQSTSQYYFVLQSLHKALPITTLYYKACTSYFPVLLCTTKLAKSISQYYFVQQSLQKVFLSTTLYYKVAQSTSQYYFVVQSLHKARSITTLLWQPMPMLMAPWSSRRRSGKTVFSDLSMAVCWDFWSEINSIWSIFVVLRLCCPVVVTVTRKGNIRKYVHEYVIWDHENMFI